MLNHQYVLATFTKKGQLIDRRVIAGTYSDGQQITRSVATIDQDWIIYVGSGQVDAHQTRDFDGTESKVFELELLADGKIVNEA